MAMSVDTENRITLRMQGWVLAARLVAVSIGVLWTFEIDTSVGMGLGVGLAIYVIAILVIRRDCWLPYCFLAAAGLWGGYAAGFFIKGDSGSGVVFIVSLAVVDALTFISSWRRRWL